MKTKKKIPSISKAFAYGDSCSRYIVLAVFFALQTSVVLAEKAFATLATNEILQKKVFTVTGLITDQNGDPVIGVTVLVKGTTNGVITDLDGKYSIKATEGAVLQFSYIGYTTQEKKIEGKTLNVRMVEDAKVLEDVVVVGFGRQKKASVVGSISAIKPEAFKLPTSSLSSSLAGRIGGVIAAQRSGEPGADGAEFWIRGIATSGSSTPLILLDGVQISAGDLNSIQPDDIESFSVLKDASATALYGVRGANGVMLITTRVGKSDEKFRINARVENSWSMPSYSLDMADGVTYMEMYNEALHNDDPTATPMYSQEQIEGTRNKLNPYLFPNVDWKKEIFKNATMNQRANVNASGGGRIAQYFISAGMYRDTGLLKSISHSSFDNNIDARRYNFQANVNANITKTTKASIKLSTVISDNKGPVTATQDVYQQIITRTNPVNFPIMFPSGSGPQGNESNILYGNKNFGGQVYYNPYAEVAKGYVNTFATTAITTFDLKQDLSMVTKGLSARGMFSYKNWNSQTFKRYFKPFYYQVNQSGQGPDGNYNYTLEGINTDGTDYLQYEQSSTGDRTIYWEGAIDYARDFGKHSVTGMLLYYQRQYNPFAPGSLFNAVPYRTTGLAGRFTYGFDSRYYAEVNFGYNGTENFAQNNQFGFFPSIALGYNIANEAFFEPLKKTINELKIRGSYGLVGNDQIQGARFPYLTEISMGGGPSYTFGQTFNNGYTGVGFTRNGNEKAKWEVGKKLNVGVDLELFGKLNLSLDYFMEKRTGIFLKPETVPTWLGYGSVIPYFNMGEVKNSGFEMTFNYNHAFNKNTTLMLQGNFVYAHNEWVKDNLPTSLYPNMSHIGNPVNSIYGLIANGLFKDYDEILNSPAQKFGSGAKPGDIKYQDVADDIANGKGITSNDRVLLGRPTAPEITYGFGGTLRYKKFDVGLFFQGNARTSFILSAGTMAPFGRWNANVAQWIADSYWSESNQNIDATYPRLSALGSENNHQNSSFWLRDGSFLKLKNAEIGYTFKFLRAYVNATNLLTFSDFKLWDPEMGGNGYYKYPTQRVVNLGVQFNF